MSGPTAPGSPPPEVPEEFAAAYRAAYEQALAAQSDGPQHRDDQEQDLPVSPATAEGREDDGQVGGGEPGEADALPARRGRLRIGTHRSAAPEYDDYDDTPTWFERVRDSTWFVPLLLALLALLLILGAYAVGRRFSGQVAGDAARGEEPTVVIGEGAEGRTSQPVTDQRPGAGAWPGTVTTVPNVRAEVGCTSPSGVDASGKTVAYGAGNLTDGVVETTWRCDGDGVGERIRLDLGEDVSVGQVGLIPGYAKTDERNRADRFAENNRVTKVRWTIGDTEVLQSMSGAPEDRSLQLLRVPRTTTDSVDLEILAVRNGPRATTAISEVRIGRAG